MPDFFVGGTPPQQPDLVVEVVLKPPEEVPTTFSPLQQFFYWHIECIELTGK